MVTDRSASAKPRRRRAKEGREERDASKVTAEEEWARRDSMGGDGRDQSLSNFGFLFFLGAFQQALLLQLQCSPGRLLAS